MKITFTVYGKPGTSGSKRAIAYKGKDGRLHAAVKKDNPLQEPFMAAVAREFVESSGGQFWPNEALALQVTIYRVRPGGHYRKGKDTSHLLTGSAPAWPATKPDSLKVVRAIEDAMAGVAYRDDSQICRHEIVKRFGEREMVEVSITDEI